MIWEDEHAFDLDFEKWIGSTAQRFAIKRKDKNNDSISDL